MTSDKPVIRKLERALEEDIKRFILRSPNLFGTLGDATAVFEKNINEYSVIADCLIFSELKGIVGVEIKTERDNTRRLNKQLNAYSALCDFAWVICHDKHVSKVEKIIDTYNHINVGIISYTIYEGEIIAGVIRDSNISPNYKPHVALDLLWKPELLSLAHKYKNGNIPVDSKYFQESGGTAPISNKMRKKQIIRWIIQMLGERNAVQEVCDMFRLQNMHPDKAIEFKKFKEVDHAKQVEKYTCGKP